MWQDKLKEIIYILENSNVNEIEINFWGRKFRVVKSPGTVLNNELQKQNAVSQPINISSSKDEKVVLRILIAKANPAVLEPTDKNATTGVGEPSYTSGVH